MGAAGWRKMRRNYSFMAFAFLSVVLVAACTEQKTQGLTGTVSGGSDGGADGTTDQGQVTTNDNDLGAPPDTDEPAGDTAVTGSGSGGEEVIEAPDEGPVEPETGSPLQVCTPGEDKKECGTPTGFYRCSPDGLNWQIIECSDPPYCFLGECKELNCPPGETMCVNPKLLRTCEEVEPGVYQWVDTATCENGICKNGKCVGGCAYNMKLNKAWNCEFWTAGFTPAVGETCTTDSLIVVPSSKNDKLAVFDISVNPPVPLEGSPFATCDDPSRILMDGNTDVIASCRKDGKIQKHSSNGDILWSTKLPACGAARGVTLNGEGRLFGGCSSNGKVYELDHGDGAVLNEVLVGGYIYGLAADPNGLYVAQFSAVFDGGLGNKGVTKLYLGGANDLQQAWQTPTPVYGLALDGQGNLWLGGNTSVRALDTDTGQQVDSYTVTSYAHGIAVGLDGNVYAGLGGKNQVARITPGGITEYLQLPAGDKHPRGVVLDAESNVYTVNMNSANLTRFDSITGTTTSFGNGMLSGPYGYSGDMTGLTSNCLVTTSSIWKTSVHDTLKAKTLFGIVKWGSSEPVGTSINMYYRLDTSSWKQIQNGQSIDELGQKIQLKAVLLSESPELVATLDWVGVAYEQ
jgi:hypothetical protein